MLKSRLRVAKGLPISVVILLILGAIAGPLIRATATQEQLNTNVFLVAIPFILIFVAIILAFITVIALVASILNNSIASRTYRIVESIIIGGIVFGIVGLFQPWVFAWYRYGFNVLLISTLSFILWSHIVPKGTLRQEEPETPSIEELERGQL
jgi:hypothetical protein